MATIVSITINPEGAIIYLGEELQYQALATYDDGTVEDITELVTWSLSAPEFAAEFDTETNGLLLSKETNTLTVYASYGSPSTTTTVTIHNPLIIDIPINLEDSYRPTVQDYLDKITSQYQNSPRFLAWVRSFLEIVEDISELAINLPFYFSFNKIVTPESAALIKQGNSLTVKSDNLPFVITGLNNYLITEDDNYLITEDDNYLITEVDRNNFEACVGDQLDIVGIILGQPRKVNFNPTDGSSPVLDDDTYRILLKNKIIINQWNGQLSSLQSFWEEVFAGGKIIVQDNQNMTIDVVLYGAFSSIIVDLIVNGYIVPRPQGVLMNYYYGTTPFFGLDRQDDYVAGFDTGNWV